MFFIGGCVFFLIWIREEWKITIRVDVVFFALHVSIASFFCVFFLWFVFFLNGVWFFWV